MGTINLEGSLTLIPNVSEFASGTSGPFPITTSPSPKTYTDRVDGVTTLASNSSFVTLYSVSDVSNGFFLYMHTSALTSVRITLAGQSPYVTLLNGTLIQEFDPSALLNLVEVEGTATIEYCAAGNS